MTSDEAARLIALAEPRFDRFGNMFYDPCVIGIHLCGSAGDPEQPYTAANIPASSHALALAMFKAAREEAECAKDDADFILDLDLGTAETGFEHVDDFWTNRQMWPRLVAAARRARAAMQEAVG